VIDDIPTRFLDKWRRLLNLAAELFDVPAALIMRLNPTNLEVLVASQNSGNPYQERTKEAINNGFYCETVLGTCKELQVVNALEDPAWSENPDIRLGLIHYLGVPLIWPDGKKFGTLCILDREPREHADVSRRLLQQFKEQIETDFSLVDFEQGLLDSKDQLELLVEQRTTDLRHEMAERERLEQALQHTRKMEALAQLASGVAHDLNNILSGIVSYPDLLLAQIDEKNPLRESLQTIRDSGTRAANVVQDLLSVTRPVPRVTEPVDVNAVISEYLDSPEGLTLLSENRNIQVELALEPRLSSIRSTPVDITKVVMNLVINAMDAMPDGGRLHIATRFEPTNDNAKVRPHAKYQDHIVLSVADSGIGIGAEEQQRIFEPYYSKKERGRSGTGLGLTTVWNIVDGCGGRIFVDSSPQGTIFELFIPAIDQDPRSQLEEVALLDEASGNELLLIVDDEPEQRDLIGSMLNALGYRTVTASSGEEAIDLVKRQSYDLVILDMAMPPGMNGLETFEELLRVNPIQKAILSSGLLRSDEIHHARELGIASMLAKPYRLAELARTVRVELTRKDNEKHNANVPVRDPQL